MGSLSLATYPPPSCDWSVEGTIVIQPDCLSRYTSASEKKLCGVIRLMKFLFQIRFRMTVRPMKISL